MEKLFDPIRNKWLVATPEEGVRQSVLAWMLENLPFSKSRYRTEFSLEVNGLRKRCDILVFDAQVKPFFLVECKAENIKINDEVLYQALRYNLTLQVNYILITNGLASFLFALDYENGVYTQISFDDLMQNLRDM